LRIEALCAGANRHRKRTGRPLVTISYAQSLDGSIAAHRGARLSLSGRESLRLCHRLRAAHDAILVGIGTILSDDPRLNVRMIKGSDPQPIVLDPTLKTPQQAKALRNKKMPWIITSPRCNASRRRKLEQKGARVIPMRVRHKGEIDLAALLDFLGDEGISSLMVEGGARVITSILRTDLVDRFALTITPFIVGGLHAVEKPPYPTSGKCIRLCGAAWYGKDLVVWGDLRCRGR
jgi:GTP cyclohydrolase II